MKNYFTLLSLTLLWYFSDIPLNNFQAQFNESLMTMYSGYHPDAFWEVEELEHKMEKLKSEKDLTASQSSKPSAVTVKFDEHTIAANESKRS